MRHGGKRGPDHPRGLPGPETRDRCCLLASRITQSLRSRPQSGSHAARVSYRVNLNALLSSFSFHIEIKAIKKLEASFFFLMVLLRAKRSERATGRERDPRTRNWNKRTQKESAKWKKKRNGKYCVIREERQQQQENDRERSRAECFAANKRRRRRRL